MLEGQYRAIYRPCAVPGYTVRRRQPATGVQQQVGRCRLRRALGLSGAVLRGLEGRIWPYLTTRWPYLALSGYLEPVSGHVWLPGVCIWPCLATRLYLSGYQAVPVWLPGCTWHVPSTRLYSGTAEESG